MKASFTIIEVLIAVVILSFVGVALLQNSAKSLNIFGHLKNKEDVSDFLTIIANHPNPNYNHLTKSLDDFLVGFQFDNDDLRRLLKKRFRLQESLVKAKMPILEGFGVENKESEEGRNTIEVNFIKLSISSPQGGDYIYRLELNE